jgi:DNA-binding NtrC family response regulator
MVYTYSDSFVENVENLFISPVMVNVLSKLKAFAQNSEPILLYGETGVGKDILAKYIYKHCQAKKKKFVVVNCYGVNYDNFVEYLTTAKERQKEKNNSVYTLLYLNEISELDIPLQSLVLQFLENIQMQSRETEKSLKIISSSTMDLLELSNKGDFKPELYFRLSSQIVYVPALTERKEEIMPLIEFFKKEANANFTIDEEVQNILKNYPWPGNIRELANTIKQFSLLKATTITKAHLPHPILRYFSLT